MQSVLAGEQARALIPPIRLLRLLPVLGWYLFFAILPRTLAVNFYVDYSSKPNHAALVAHDFSIVSPNAEIDLDTLHQLGRKAFAYLSVVEIAPDAPYRSEVVSRKIPLLGSNDLWKSDLADTASPAWRDYLIETLAPRIMEKPFDGFFLDTPDSVDLLAARHPDRAASFRDGLVELVRALKVKFPSKAIIYNRGFSTWEPLRQSLDGVLVESMFQTVNLKTGEYAPTSESESADLRSLAGKIRSTGLPIYVIDYVDPRNTDLAFATSRKIEQAGFTPFISTPALDGQALAPLRLVPRHVLVLFGNRAEGLDRVFWPADSAFAFTAQLPLEWLGYESDYLNIRTANLPENLAADQAAVIFDRFVELPPEKEADIAAWLIAQKKRGKKVIFLGSIPFYEQEVRAKVLKEFGLKGLGSQIQVIPPVQKTRMSPLMNFESEVIPLASRFIDLRASDQAAIHCALQARDATGGSHQFDAVFTDDWGGVALDPYLFFRRPDFDEFWLINPFEFFALALGNAEFPAPDTTTCDGNRILFTHIDGDGFRHNSSAIIGKTAGEVVVDEIINKYPVPFTCSVIESEVRGLVKDQKAGDSELLIKVAKEMFALPKVEAASHSYSHPFYWIEGDRTSSLYEEQNLELKPEFDLKGINLAREITGSMNYIQENLLPPGKTIKVFLWSGNCRPPPEALRLVRERGAENLNGGTTIISRRHPTLTKAAPRSMIWGDEIQVFAPDDNDNVFQQAGAADENSATFKSGFMHVIETFQRTESPRRLKPVDIYFHFYSGDNFAALKALTKVFDWAMSEELHSLHASQYTRIVRDCRRVQPFRAGSNQWVIISGGNLRTYRLPSRSPLPDLAASKGITGYRVTTNAVYVHTDGSPRVVLSLSKSPAPHLFLIKSSAEIQFSKSSATEAEFTVQDLREVNVAFGGLLPGKKLNVTVNGITTEMATDDKGEFSLRLPAEARVHVLRL